MKVRVSQNKINSVLSVVVSTEDWSRHELDSIVRFGEPSIQIGGRFLKHCTRCMPSPCREQDESCWFEIPEQEKKIRSDFPILVEFGPEDFDEPGLCAKSWSDAIVGRIAKEVERLRRTSANLVKEETYEF